MRTLGLEIKALQVKKANIFQQKLDFLYQMSCLKISIILGDQNFISNIFGGHLIKCPHSLNFKAVLCETLPFITLFFISQTNVEKFDFSEREINK